MLYLKSVIDPHISYCCTIWGHATQTHLAPLINLQQRCIKTCFSLDLKHFSPDLCIKTNLLLLPDKLSYYLAQIPHKFFYDSDSLPAYFTSLFHEITLSHSHATRQSTNGLFIPQANTNLRKASVAYHGPLLWNQIPSEIRNITTIILFKKR